MLAISVADTKLRWRAAYEAYCVFSLGSQPGWHGGRFNIDRTSGFRRRPLRVIDGFDWMSGMRREYCAEEILN